MSWTLETSDGRSLDVNAWNWRPTLALLEEAGVLDAETAGLLGFNSAIELTGDEARRIAVFLDGYLTTSVPAEGRVLLNGSVTTEPDTYEFHRDDLARNYSVSAEWLARFRDFCRNATNGFTVS
ncbi:hypothetical protein AB0I81_14845 [Nonomuraea sp. NPDC050404]|uniref:hypothetical protein n=1 Tax=Nonomuraea sp. NPDC050404 TaxID=3155783 RepID=UPI0033EBC0C9